MRLHKRTCERSALRRLNVGTQPACAHVYTHVYTYANMHVYAHLYTETHVLFDTKAGGEREACGTWNNWKMSISIAKTLMTTEIVI